MIGIIYAGDICAFELATDRAGRTAKELSNGSDAALVGAYKHNDRAVSCAPVNIVSRHGSTSQQVGIHLVLEDADWKKTAENC